MMTTTLTPQIKQDILKDALELAMADIENQIATCPDTVHYSVDLALLEQRKDLTKQVLNEVLNAKS